MAGASDLYDAAEALLTAAATAVEASGQSAPEGRYVSAGPPVFDCCDLMTVHVQLHDDVAMREAGNQGLPQMRPAVPMTVFVVTTLRCYPIVTGGVAIRVPDAAKLDAASRVIYLDGWSLWNGLRTLIRQDRLFPGRPCRSVGTGSLAPAPTQGGCGGWTLPVMVEIDGWAPAL